MFEWSIQHAWIIALLPFLAFGLIGLFLHKWPKISAYLSHSKYFRVLCTGGYYWGGMFVAGEAITYEAAVKNG